MDVFKGAILSLMRNVRNGFFINKQSMEKCVFKKCLVKEFNLSIEYGGAAYLEALHSNTPCFLKGMPQS